MGPSLDNLFGIGLTDLPTITIGTKIFDIENVLRIPKWLVRRVSPIEFQAEVTRSIASRTRREFGDADAPRASP